MAKSKKTGITKSNINKKDLKKQSVDYLSSHQGEVFTLKKFFSALNFTSHPIRMLCVDVLNELLDENVIARNTDGEFYFNGQFTTAEGIFNRTSGGRNFVDTDDGVGISVYDEDTMHALPGDRVKVSLLAKKRGSNKLHGQITAILKRNEKPWIGTLQVQHSVAFLISQSGTLPHDILIPMEKTMGGKNGQKALVKIVDWPQGSRNPIGEVIDILGDAGDNTTEMHAILAEYNLPYKYPEKVVQAAEKLDPGITPEEIAKREDCRDTLTFTIDPRDAKDFDDALSIKKLKDGLWEIGVHIADVSHYVTEGSIIDQEAQQRATSVYLVDRTIPMLPERLCNFICSLRPNEEKLCYSVIFEMNDEAEVLNYRIRHTVIKSNRRFTYEEVQAVLEAHNEATECELIRAGKALPTEPIPAEEVTPDTVQPAAEEYAEELITLNRLAKILRENRFKVGAISFDREEVRFEIDKDGKPLRVYFKNAKDANKLIEEYMLLANRTVAEHVGKDKKKGKAKTLPYRIHDVPDPNKLENLALVAARLGYILRTTGSKTEVADSLNGLLEAAKGQPVESLVENVSLRAMQKARYSTVNIGHYGLAFDYYTHFTSPIRRYPDTMVHRLLTKYEAGGESASQTKYEDLCEHSSAMEQLAAAAERASIKYKQVEFMQDKIGEEFDAKISGVTEFGIYAEIIENRCEGLIPIRYLGDEAWDYDDRNFCLVGRKTHHKLTLGDEIRIKVVKADLVRKTLDFEFIRKLSAEKVDAKPFYLSFVDSEQKSAKKAKSLVKKSKSSKQKSKKKR